MILIVVAALVLLSVGVVVAVRVSGRSKATGPLGGEPGAPIATTVAPPALDADRPDADGRGARSAPPRRPQPRSTNRPRPRPKSSKSRGCAIGSAGTRKAFSGAFGRIRGRKIDDETWDELEESLLLADVGMPTTDTPARRGAHARQGSSRRPSPTS